MLYDLFAALATWRLARMLAKETGPFALFQTWRDYSARKLPAWVGEGVNCVACLSFWIGLALSLLAGDKQGVKFALIRGTAYSAVAVILMRLLG